MIIGVSGRNCAGKDTVADYLKSKGYLYLSLSDAIREELSEKGIPPTRENLISAGNSIRDTFGPRELARRIAKKILPSKNYVIVSIRNPYEADELSKIEGFFLIDVAASKRVRFERMLLRARGGDPKTFEDFCRVEEAEISSPNSNAQQLDAVSKMADFEVRNDSGLGSLHKQIDKIISQKVGKNE